MKSIIGLCIGVFLGAFAAYIYFINVNMAGAAGYVFAIIGGSSGIVGAMAYFFRTYYEHQLELVADKHKLKFSKTYQLRTDAISEIHGRLLDLYEAVKEFAGTGGSEEAGSAKWLEAVERVRIARNTFIDTIARRGLYMPKKLAKKTRALSGHFYGHHVRFTMLKSHPKEERSEEVKKWCDANEQLPALLEELEKEFTDVLGFTD